MPAFKLNDVVGFKWDPATMTLATLPDGFNDDPRITLVDDQLVCNTGSIVNTYVAPSWYLYRAGTLLFAMPAVEFENKYAELT